MQRMTANEQWGHEFVRQQMLVYGRVWKEEGIGKNILTVFNLNKERKRKHPQQHAMDEKPMFEIMENSSIWKQKYESKPQSLTSFKNQPTIKSHM